MIANIKYLYHHGGHYSLLSTRLLNLVTVITTNIEPSSVYVRAHASPCAWVGWGVRWMRMNPLCEVKWLVALHNDQATTH